MSTVVTKLHEARRERAGGPSRAAERLYEFARRTLKPGHIGRLTMRPNGKHDDYAVVLEDGQVITVHFSCRGAKVSRFDENGRYLGSEFLAGSRAPQKRSPYKKPLGKCVKENGKSYEGYLALLRDLLADKPHGRVTTPRA